MLLTTHQFIVFKGCDLFKVIRSRHVVGDGFVVGTHMNQKRGHLSRDASKFKFIFLNI